MVFRYLIFFEYLCILEHDLKGLRSAFGLFVHTHTQRGFVKTMATDKTIHNNPYHKTSKRKLRK